ncbi:hypothetical protein KFE25_013716 [Diacronema lutheri]|uniref:Uncharacterized protein n=1 Tax=Diacronema lutheri TaxID=2081491 RepID=A0A8J5XJ53_DIALT|nr:hypothetical protein KFE25_013716 [Diacronema lutheri]
MRRFVLCRGKAEAVHVPGPMPLSPTPVGPAQRTSGHTGEASRVEVPASASKCNSAPRTGSRAACEVPSPSGVLEFSAVSPPSASGVRPFAGSDEQALLRDRSFGAQLKQRHDAEQQPLVALPVGAALPPLKAQPTRPARAVLGPIGSSANQLPGGVFVSPIADAQRNGKGRPDGKQPGAPKTSKRRPSHRKQVQWGCEDIASLRLLSPQAQRSGIYAVPSVDDDIDLPPASVVLRAAREAVEDDDLVVREFLSPGASSDSPRR